MLHTSFQCDVAVLVHKQNSVRGSWFDFGTEGKAKVFLNNKVKDLWKEHIKESAVKSGEYI